ncbi:hypothetical protein ASPWEDRAFT_176661 [Aspergillus wentii DTO 134E9]|uniref:AB hydrolase-1 domain-containing protein n=1 Tax=Aspergillus wentii DTO 134E9 TaxID=1073089 RepID=A0A1L9R9J6_ASPWE|nr:uncharacterized protein ASPWEDRAFT_176661 [Aspergillus wentii DTO 134E9]OJJ31596.1 hypothetical protein ASPWEDRAFT_176661 [Aspergillus wentii DTO 134E9]
MSQPDLAALHYISSNPSAQTTILLIHGAFCSSEYWDLVIPHLSTSYHLLVPDLPGHAKSRSITPFTVDTSADLLAQLIRKEAKNGSAHVIGHSLGAHVAITLASAYPDLVQDVFVSGFAIFPPSAMAEYAPYLIWPVIRVENMIPRSVISWLMDGTDVVRLDTSVCTLDLCRQVMVALRSSGEWPAPWRARTLVVAAIKGGIIPSSDNAEYAGRLAEIGREVNPETIAVIHPDMRHPWNRQAPGLFAETARAWFERRDLPEGFLPCESTVE